MPAVPVIVHYRGKNETTHNLTSGIGCQWTSMVWRICRPIVCAKSTNLQGGNCTSMAQKMYLKDKFWVLKIPNGIPTGDSFPISYPKSRTKSHAPKATHQNSESMHQLPKATHQISYRYRALLGSISAYRRVTNPPEEAPIRLTSLGPRVRHVGTIR